MAEREEILNMLAGRDMDRAIAALVEDRDDGVWWWSKDGSEKVANADGGPREYSTEIKDAWRLVDRLPDRFLIAADVNGWHIRETLCVTYHGESGEKTYQAKPIASGVTMPVAICRAVLVMGVRDDRT